MSKKNEIVATEHGNIPAEMAEMFTNDAKDNMANVQDPFFRISVKGGKFKVEGTPIGDKGMSFEATIMREIPVNVFYKTPYDPDNPSLPDCWSLGGFKPQKDCEDKQAEKCSDCPQNKFGTSVQRDGTPGKGKACANTRRLVLNIPGMEMPAILTLPPTSRKNIDQYLKRLSSNQPPLPVFAMKTEFAFDENIDEYPVVTMAPKGVHDKETYLHLKEVRSSEFIEKVIHAYAIGDEVEETPEDGDEHF